MITGDAGGKMIDKGANLGQRMIDAQAQRDRRARLIDHENAIAEYEAQAKAAAAAREKELLRREAAARRARIAAYEAKHGDPRIVRQGQPAAKPKALTGAERAQAIRLLENALQRAGYPVDRLEGRAAGVERRAFDENGKLYGSDA